MNDRERYQWRQPTPLMQLRALVAALEGNTSNQREGITSPEQYCAKAGELSDQLFALVGYVEKNPFRWGPSSDELFARCVELGADRAAVAGWPDEKRKIFISANHRLMS